MWILKYHANDHNNTHAVGRAYGAPLMRGVQAVGKSVDNLRLIKIEAERFLKLNWQRFMNLIFTYRRSFEEIFRTIFYPWVFLQPRYAADTSNNSTPDSQTVQMGFLCRLN
jgi:hypothetical protein